MRSAESVEVFLGPSVDRSGGRKISDVATNEAEIVPGGGPQVRHEIHGRDTIHVQEDQDIAVRCPAARIAGSRQWQSVSWKRDETYGKWAGRERLPLIAHLDDNAFLRPVASGQTFKKSQQVTPPALIEGDDARRSQAGGAFKMSSR